MACQASWDSNGNYCIVVGKPRSKALPVENPNTNTQLCWGSVSLKRFVCILVFTVQYVKYLCCLSWLIVPALALCDEPSS